MHPAENIHHKTYRRRYAELLSDLLGLCRGCHEHNHDPSLPDPLVEAANALASPRPLMISNSARCFSGSIVYCPYCGTTSVHLESAEWAPDSDDGNQGRVVIHCYGECPHQWDMVFAGHKGTLVAFTRNCRPNSNA